MAVRLATQLFRSAAPARVVFGWATAQIAPAAAALGSVPEERRAIRVTAHWHDQILRMRGPSLPELRHDRGPTLREAAESGGQP